MTNRYDNPAYGFTIQFPHQLSTCTTPAPGPNHGFVALLRSDSCRDGVFEQKPHLELFVRYDVITMAKSAAELADELCENKPARRSNIRSAGLAVYQCQAILVGELTLWRYFFLHPQRNGAGQIYSLDLYSDQAHAVQDRRLQKQMLQQLKFTLRQ
ncbi:hypothetical protein ACO0LD_14770 [Undibacterium sp. Ji83W]|uniref:hypothetical protein n=1 Tax=Undibacterium sp. Ji83W TaxID=3413043 RepID=UPI003BF37137